MAAYFRRLVPGAAHSRYFIGFQNHAGVFVVERTQISRPDGEEIREPARVSMPISVPTVHQPARKRLRDAADHARNARELAPVLPDTKRCPCCKKELPANAFSTHVRHGNVRLQSWCKACMVASAAAKRAIARAMKEAA
jgi:hypothetical protein